VAISLGIVTVLFAMIFKLMPTARIAWRDVWIGAAVTAVLFELGKLAIGLYLGKSGVNESFAAAGSLVVLVAWVYYAAQIFLLGAEFTKVYANEHGSVYGVKAVAATEAKAADDAAGIDRVAAGAAVVPVEPPPDYSGIGRTADAQREIDRRVQSATAALIRQMLLLGAVTLGNVLTKRWLRKQKRNGRKAAR
jgi:membrane protein